MLKGDVYFSLVPKLCLVHLDYVSGAPYLGWVLRHFLFDY